MDTRRRLIVGIGNALRGDDGVGPAVAEWFRDGRGPGRERRVLAVHQLLPELSDALGACDIVVFVDASGSAPPGSVVTRAVGGVASRAPGAAPALGHSFSPEQLLALVAALHGRRPSAWVVEIGAGRFELGAPFSEPVRAAMDEAVAEIERLLARA